MSERCIYCTITTGGHTPGCPLHPTGAMDAAKAAGEIAGDATVESAVLRAIMADAELRICALRDAISAESDSEEQSVNIARETRNAVAALRDDVERLTKERDVQRRIKEEEKKILIEEVKKSAALTKRVKELEDIIDEVRAMADDPGPCGFLEPARMLAAISNVIDRGLAQSNKKGGGW